MLQHSRNQHHWHDTLDRSSTTPLKCEQHGTLTSKTTRYAFHLCGQSRHDNLSATDYTQPWRLHISLRKLLPRRFIYTATTLRHPSQSALDNNRRSDYSVINLISLPPDGQFISLFTHQLINQNLSQATFSSFCGNKTNYQFPLMTALSFISEHSHPSTISVWSSPLITEATPYESTCFSTTSLMTTMKCTPTCSDSHSNPYASKQSTKPGSNLLTRVRVIEAYGSFNLSSFWAIQPSSTTPGTSHQWYSIKRVYSTPSTLPVVSHLHVAGFDVDIFQKLQGGDP